jgi:predicted dehydrogenase
MLAYPHFTRLVSATTRAPRGNERHGEDYYFMTKERFFEEVQQAKQLLDQGNLGKITHFRLMFGGYLNMAGSWYADKDISGGGIVMDNGPHAIDLVRYLLGNIKHVSARFANIQNLNVEDTALLSLELDSGAVGTVDISWSTSIPSKHYMEIYGENGTVLLDLKGISYQFKTWNEFRRVDNKLDPKGAFAVQFHHFINAVSGILPTVIKNEDGVETQKIIDAAYRSIVPTEHTLERSIP